MTHGSNTLVLKGMPVIQANALIHVIPGTLKVDRAIQDLSRTCQGKLRSPATYTVSIAVYLILL